MTSRRLWILILGPVPIVAASMALSRWSRSPAQDMPLAKNHVVVRGQSPANAATSDGEGRRGHESLPPAGTDLRKACRTTAEQLRPQLGDDCELIVHEPFVIAGDLSKRDLEQWHSRTIGPAARAMAASYFSTPPSEPITVLLFSGEKSYNHYARRLFADEGVSIYGYYKPGQRVLVMNIGTGGGTLVHELTHALMDFDFPTVPDWFNEGLASLHEQCRFREDRSGIDGLVNWRLPILQRALQEGELRPLADLIRADDFRGDREGVNYAQARYFCMYMQEQGVLEDYFRLFRTRQKEDPLGYATVSEVFPDRSWAELDADFRAWARDLRQ